jgi:hypothetical protein
MPLVLKFLPKKRIPCRDAIDETAALDTKYTSWH